MNPVEIPPAGNFPSVKDAIDPRALDPSLSNAVDAVEGEEANTTPEEGLGDGMTLDRSEGLPEEVQDAPETPPSQDAPSLDDLLASAVAPEDEDVELSEEDLGPPHYTSIQRRTSPPRMVPIRIFPKAVGSVTVYMLTVNRDAQSEGDQDTYPLTKTVRINLTRHPVFQKQIRRFQVRLGVTSLGKPFFLEINLDDQGIWGTTRRDIVAIAETQWILISSDRSTGYVHHPSDHDGDPVLPEQSFEELYSLTYKAPLISSLSHPVIRRGALRKVKPKADKS
jgi:hypothetical protein